MQQKLSPVINVDKDKCKNCHACITVCPVKYCIDGSGEYVAINHDMCIGCGRCITACSHNARSVYDDAEEFFARLSAGESIIAIVAPAVAAVFPESYLKFNTFLKSIGVKAVFDVSFGAELTVKSYSEFIKKNNPDLVISQPCPAIVTYLQIYHKELLKHLAPLDSPMLHTVKMIKNFYGRYKKHKIAAISPCPAKRREFDETGSVDFNVTFGSLKKYLGEKEVNLNSFSISDYDNPSAERAVLFSSPGGLLRTVERDNPELLKRSRKIEGTDIVYKYFEELGGIIEKKMNPQLIDCLNCELGCNGGPGTGNADKSPDEIEYHIEKRSMVLKERYRGFTGSDKSSSRNVDRVLSGYYSDNLYRRSYLDLSGNFDLKFPSEKEKQDIYKSMMKFSDDDLINCSSCGYGSCENMAVAVFNKLNKPENCHYYKASVIYSETEVLEKLYISLHEEISKSTELIGKATAGLSSLASDITLQAGHLEESSAAVRQMIGSIKNVAKITGSRKETISSLTVKAVNGENDIQSTLESMEDMMRSVGGINEMVEIINSITSNTNLLSLNAAIEAAHAGTAGKGFAVVADEIGRLSEVTGENSIKISETLKQVEKRIKDTRDITVDSGENLQQIIDTVRSIAESLSEVIVQMDEMSAGTNQVMSSLSELNSISKTVKDSSSVISGDIGNIETAVRRMADMSERTMDNFRNLTSSF